MGKQFYILREKDKQYFFVFPIFPSYCAVDKKKHTDEFPAIAICPVNRISRRSAMELATNM